MLEVKIETRNAAFAEGNEGAEAARILREVADKIEQESKLSESCRPLRDICGGGKVGFFKTWTEQEEEA
tara:strand:+ start:677 stop:883 length:207 start_codon:yes stop_codon:yes gene_type:complete